jgi:hypothetical protein
MNFELRKIFSSLKKFKKLKNQIELSNSYTEKINVEKEKLDLFEYDILREKGQEYYISFQDFEFFLENQNYELRDILSRFKHIGELDKKRFSCLEAYAVSTEEGILLTTTPPEGRKVNKVKIVSCSTK